MRFDQQARKQPLVFRQHHGRVRTDDDDQVITLRQIMLHQPKRFAKQALDSVALDRNPDASGNAQTQARMVEIVREREKNERTFADLYAAVKNRFKFETRPDAMRFGEWVLRIRHKSS